MKFIINIQFQIHKPPGQSTRMAKVPGVQWRIKPGREDKVRASKQLDVGHVPS